MASSSNKWTNFGRTLKKMDDPLSCLKLVQISEVIKLSCEFVGVDITPGVREQLNMKLLLYSERFLILYLFLLGFPGSGYLDPSKQPTLQWVAINGGKADAYNTPSRSTK